MPTDSFTSALERLDPASRALLDLSLRRGMRTEEIAEVLGAETESVEASRDEALRRIAVEVGMEDDAVRDRLAELPPDEWIGGNGSTVVEAPEAEAEAEAEAETEEPEPAAEPPAEDKPKRRGGIWPLLLGLLLTAGVIVAIALGTGDNGDESTVSQPSSSNAQKPAPAPKTESGAAKLQAVGSVKGTGEARVSGGKLRLTASLPRGTYEVWLYNSILDARSIARAKGARISVNAKLPGNWKRFRFVDVSRERRDGNLSHSGESVLRLRTKTLR
jgi:hypothetical protein